MEKWRRATNWTRRTESGRTDGRAGSRRHDPPPSAAGAPAHRPALPSSVSEAPSPSSGGEGSSEQTHPAPARRFALELFVVCHPRPGLGEAREAAPGPLPPSVGGRVVLARLLARHRPAAPHGARPRAPPRPSHAHAPCFGRCPRMRAFSYLASTRPPRAARAAWHITASAMSTRGELREWSSGRGWLVEPLRASWVLEPSQPIHGGSPVLPPRRQSGRQTRLGRRDCRGGFAPEGGGSRLSLEAAAAAGVCLFGPSPATGRSSRHLLAFVETKRRAPGLSGNLALRGSVSQASPGADGPRGAGGRPP